jgi:hypothetical protein
MTRATALLLLAIAVFVPPAAVGADEATVAFVNGRAAYEGGDYEAAVSAWERAAGLGHAEAAFRLGAMHEAGKGVPEDLETALEWYRQAAARGSQKAMFNLGHLHAKGDGVERDEAVAADWYRRAAQLGNAHAQYTLGLMYSQGRGVERDLVHAYAWLTVAIHNLDPTMFRDNANDARREIAGRMSDEQQAEAERLLDQWASARD